MTELTGEILKHTMLEEHNTTGHGVDSKKVLEFITATMEFLDHGNPTVKDMRSYNPRAVRLVFHMDEMVKGFTKIKKTWAPENKPAGWPEDVPFEDPNNGSRTNKKTWAPENTPAGWPEDVPFEDPNNGSGTKKEKAVKDGEKNYKQNDKLKKDGLNKMYTFLRREYLRRQEKILQAKADYVGNLSTSLRSNNTNTLTPRLARNLQRAIPDFGQLGRALSVIDVDKADLEKSAEKSMGMSILDAWLRGPSSGVHAFIYVKSSTMSGFERNNNKHAQLNVDGLGSQRQRQVINEETENDIQCAQVQKDEEDLAILVLDEIGLADVSLWMPLKASNELLKDGCTVDEEQGEKPKMNPVWRLDVWKIQEEPPDDIELEQTNTGGTESSEVGVAKQPPIDHITAENMENERRDRYSKAARLDDKLDAFLSRLRLMSGIDTEDQILKIFCPEDKKHEVEQSLQAELRNVDEGLHRFVEVVTMDTRDFCIERHKEPIDDGFTYSEIDIPMNEEEDHEDHLPAFSASSQERTELDLGNEAEPGELVPAVKQDILRGLYLHIVAFCSFVWLHSIGRISKNEIPAGEAGIMRDYIEYCTSQQAIWIRDMFRYRTRTKDMTRIKDITRIPSIRQAIREDEGLKKSFIELGFLDISVGSRRRLYQLIAKNEGLKKNIFMMVHCIATCCSSLATWSHQMPTTIIKGRSSFGETVGRGAQLI